MDRCIGVVSPLVDGTESVGRINCAVPFAQLATIANIGADGTMDKTLKKLAPVLVVLVWVAVVLMGVWRRDVSTEHPPIYDPLSYFLKARNFWLNLHSRKPINPFNLQPTFRPPGTVLMSFPFGFSPDFHGFFFRSVAFPMLGGMLAVYLAALGRRRCSKAPWVIAAAALAFGSLPMFFHFESSNYPIAPVIWGMVDNFLAAVAALASAAAIQSLLRRSLSWAWLAWILAAYCVLIKPSGAVVMALIAGGWAWILLLCFAKFKDERKATLEFFWKGFAAMLCVFLPTAFACFHSQYLSGPNLAWGTSAIEIMRHDLSLSFGMAMELLRASFGYVVPAGVVAMIASWPLVRRRFAGNCDWELAVTDGCWLFGVFCLAFGVWFWLVGSAGANQIRYFYPFAAMSFLFLLPSTITLLSRSSRLVALAVCVAILTWSLNIALVLVLPSSEFWQGWSGINVTTGQFNAELREAHNLVDQLRKENRDADVYSLYSNGSTAAFEGVGNYEGVVHPELPDFRVHVPLDWRRPSTVRLDQLLNSDYVLFGPMDANDARSTIKAIGKVDTFWQELELFRAWFSCLNEAAGIAVAAQTPSMRLLHIEDPSALEEHLGAFRAQHVWPSSFEDVNPRHWWTEQELDQEELKRPPALTGITFGNRFRFDALSLEHKGNQLFVRVWWERLEETDKRQWYLFLHLLGKHGRLIKDEQLNLPTRPLPAKSAPIALDVLNFPLPVDTSISAIGVGIYNESGEKLLADRGKRDWGNTRVILPPP